MAIDTQMGITASVAADKATTIYNALGGEASTWDAECWSSIFNDIFDVMLDAASRPSGQAPEQQVATPPAPAATGVAQPAPPPVAQPVPPQPAPQPVPGTPTCPHGHGYMKPVEQEAGKRRPLWKCSLARYDKMAKREIGCPFVIWPPDENAA